MPIPAGLAAAARLLASKGTREAAKKYSKKVIDQVKAYNAGQSSGVGGKSKTMEAARTMAGSAARAKSLQDQTNRKDTAIKPKPKPKPKLKPKLKPKPKAY